MTLKIPHGLYYLFELIVLLIGFFIIFLLSSNFYYQALTLALVLIFYSTLGILHHGLQHTLRRKIVIEYILISLVLLAVFIFLHVNKA